jgi:hypothetical protein
MQVKTILGKVFENKRRFAKTKNLSKHRRMNKAKYSTKAGTYFLRIARQQVKVAEMTGLPQQQKTSYFEANGIPFT